MRIVGVFYLLQFVMNAFVRAPIRVMVSTDVLARASAGDATARFLVDTWVTFGLEVGVIGAALLIASRMPERARALVWTVIGIDLVRGIVADIYMILRGQHLAPLLIWIGVHSVIIVSGVFCVRTARSVESATATH